MNRPIGIVLIFMSMAFGSNAYMDLYGGVSWPKTLESRTVGKEKVMGTVGIEGGRQFGSVFSLGGVFEYSFKGRRTETIEEISNDSTGSTQITMETQSVRRKIFSTGIAARLSPFKESRIRPAVHANFLPSMMVLVNEFDTTLHSALPPTGVYWGLLSTVEGEVQMMISEECAFYLGTGYRFGSVRKAISTDREEQPFNRTYYQQSMEGMVIRVGFSIGI